MTKPPRTVVALEVEAFKRITAAHVKPNATGLVPVRGRNAAGKSSLIESMEAALLGKAGKVELPIMEGEHGAHVVVDLGDLVVKRRWTRDSGGKAKTSLTVENGEGHPQKGPQAILDGLVGRFADPVAFLDAPAAEQVKTVLHVLGLSDELQEIESRAGGWYDRRRDLGRDVDRTAKASAEIDAEIQGLPAPPEGAGLEELAEELQLAKDHNAGLEAHRHTMTSTAARGKEAADRLERLQLEVGKLVAEVEAQRAAWSAAAEAVNAAGGLKEVAPIVEAMRAHEEAGKAAGKRELAEAARDAHTAAKVEHDEAEEELGKARQEIAELLGEATFPIEEMAYDHEAKVLTIGGIPFSQASQAERLKAAAAVAMAGSPNIRVMFAREGSLLDAESRQQLAELAEASGFQLWLEVVDSNPEGAGVWIEDGKASQGAPDGPEA